MQSTYLPLFWYNYLYKYAEQTRNSRSIGRYAFVALSISMSMQLSLETHNTPKREKCEHMNLITVSLLFHWSTYTTVQFVRKLNVGELNKISVFFSCTFHVHAIELGSTGFFYKKKEVKLYKGPHNRGPFLFRDLHTAHTTVRVQFVRKPFLHRSYN